MRVPALLRQSGLLVKEETIAHVGVGIVGYGPELYYAVADEKVGENAYFLRMPGNRERLPDLGGKETGNIMANKHHLEILRQSNADTWKAWRQAHALLLPDLYSADLSEADLHNYNLSGVELSDANLTGADLTGANLLDANMRGATLNWAQLDDARITHEQLRTVKSRLQRDN